MKRINYIIDDEQLSACKTKKFIFSGLIILSIVLFLGYISVFGLGRYWWVLVVGMISFATSMGIVVILILLYTVIWNFHMIRKHPDLWRRTFFRISIQERARASQETRLLKDPFIEKIGFLLNKAGILILKFWLVSFSIFVFFTLVWGMVKNML